MLATCSLPSPNERTIGKLKMIKWNGYDTDCKIE